MAQNIFDATNDVNNNIRRNTFDWNHANNFTTEIGRITPVFCQQLPPNSSVRIDPTFALKMMPMAFPIQTRMKARLSFFRMPIRALWDDYRDFVGNFREGLTPPYIDFLTQQHHNAMAATGSLGDYLGLPTTLGGSFGTVVSLSLADGVEFNSNPQTVSVPDGYLQHGVKDSYSLYNFVAQADSGYPYTTYSVMKDGFTFQPQFSFNRTTNAMSVVSYGYMLDIGFNESYSEADVFRVKIGDLSMTEPVARAFYDSLSFVPMSNYDGNSLSSATYYDVSPRFLVRDDGYYATFNMPSDFATGGQCYVMVLVNSYTRLDWNTLPPDTLTLHLKSGWSNIWNVGPPDDVTGNTITSATPFTAFSSVAGLMQNLLSSATITLNDGNVSDLTYDDSPYYNSHSVNADNQLKVSAYSFRTYEACYNAYFRDDRNNPYYVNGRVEYNKWIPSDAGGADSNIYSLRYANWEKDYLTTAVHSPQQGIAPLVGLTTYTDTTRAADGTLTTVQKMALVDEQGSRYGIEFDSDADGLNDVRYTELDKGIAVTSGRSLIDLASSGISIADLRNVNAYQKYLELNMRKGYSYRNIIEGRFDVKVRYDSLLMPEFIGGVTRDIDVNPVTQSVERSDSGMYADALGSQSGIGYVSGSPNSTISCFCDEESIVIGLLTVVPLPVYTQLLPKHFLYRDLLDSFNPEFDNIGFQPITYKEVCPVQSYNYDPKSLSDVFGYQRPWYEYVALYDTAHGLFRTQLRNFLMNRTFDVRPELSESFLLIDPEQVNDVFSVTETTDKILGQIFFDCTAKLPISRVAIPRLD